MIRRLSARLRDWGLNREVFLLGLARAVDSFGGSLMIILIPLFIKHFDVSFLSFPTALIVGLVLSIYGFTNTSIQPAIGIMIDRTGRNKIFISTGLILYALATVLFAYVRSFYLIAVLRVLQGIGVALTIPSSLALMTEYTQTRSRGTAMSFYNVMRLIGFSTGPVVGGYLITWFSFEPVILLAAATGFLGAALVHLLVREVEVEKTTAKSTLLEDFQAFLDPEMADFIKLALANVAMALSISLVAPLENKFNERLHQTPGDFGVAFSALIVTMVIVQIPIGRLADTFGRKRLIVIGLLILIPSTVYMGFLSSTTHFVLTRMTQGVGVACIAAPSFALGGDKSDQGKRGREMSLLTMAFGLGIALGPLMAGFLAGHFPFSTPFLVGGMLLAASVGLVEFSVSPSKLTSSKEPSGNPGPRT